jgi:hypothetical protein
MSLYDDFSVLFTKTPKYEQYYTPGQIPPPIYLGGRGDICESTTDCHQNLYCTNKKCTDWIPTLADTPKLQSEPVTRPKSVKEKFQSVPGVDFYGLSPSYDEFPITTGSSTEIKYTSSRKANSGRNYW